ncbi:hypothetical protein F2P56_011488 [Juglans regia]|uniref:Phytosulfokine n=2 Tax=Juglans regia TaxID=51240 RepID=A0A834CUC2_JUGRE|nr:uncharacterized protein LOC109011845 [Juglans regia]KAF5471009.1 hypothetical protein F2P56_011488 [Juglans regia]
MTMVGWVGLGWAHIKVPLRRASCELQSLAFSIRMFYIQHQLSFLPPSKLPTVYYLLALLYYSLSLSAMKQSLHSNALLLFLLFLISYSEISARSIPVRQEQEKVKLNEITPGGSLVELDQGSKSMNELMGMEDCNKGDEECLQRRILTEVHLDYIYTQHHKP